MQRTKEAIVATLCYSDIFDYPLTKSQLWRYLLTAKKISFSAFEKALNEQFVKEDSGRFYLPGRKKLILLAQRKAKISKQKLQKAQKIADYLSYIPSIEFIGLSGSLAMQNGDRDADIDLFLITKSSTLWITRLLVLFLLDVKKLRRKRGLKKAPNSVCINMLLDTKHLAFVTKRRNIYTAHELLQMKPLFRRGTVYAAFLRQNKWVASFLPNAFPRLLIAQKEKFVPSTVSFLQPLESLAQFFQLWYMKEHRGKEIIENGFVAFHPFNYQEFILREWEKRKKRYVI